MGNTRISPIQSDRVDAARARAERLIEEQGTEPVDFAQLLAAGMPLPDPEDEFLQLLHEWRTEGELEA